MANKFKMKLIDAQLTDMQGIKHGTPTEFRTNLSRMEFKKEMPDWKILKIRKIF